MVGVSDRPSPSMAGCLDVLRRALFVEKAPRLNTKAPTTSYCFDPIICKLIHPTTSPPYTCSFLLKPDDRLGQLPALLRRESKTRNKSNLQCRGKVGQKQPSLLSSNRPIPRPQCRRRLTFHPFIVQHTSIPGTTSLFTPTIPRQES